jgi:hypothetical protein
MKPMRGHIKCLLNKGMKIEAEVKGMFLLSVEKIKEER